MTFACLVSEMSIAEARQARPPFARFEVTTPDALGFAVSWRFPSNPPEYARPPRGHATWTVRRRATGRLMRFNLVISLGGSFSHKAPPLVHQPHLVPSRIDLALAADAA